ncbi:hypothetical protein F9C07_261 [Aspergillus flavus]|uniref:Uncharacterized protein n=1 Tax=Aspergillus flavus (strain ATCC 200026 / FGSC A1120 / IAM 13836 / NRRL 3357 / JCM 12722 / SRRC 167) TaxID=332952 RepID=A0A7U2MNV5_ASPFN|nr:hypothetical protein F9C07_261 [Aspergillus flavus]
MLALDVPPVDLVFRSFKLVEERFDGPAASDLNNWKIHIKADKLISTEEIKISNKSGVQYNLCGMSKNGVKKIRLLEDYTRVISVGISSSCTSVAARQMLSDGWTTSTV